MFNIHFGKFLFEKFKSISLSIGNKGRRNEEDFSRTKLSVYQ